MSDIKITAKHVDEIFQQSTIEVHKLGEKTTVVHARLPNGFEIVSTSACVDAENYDHDLGKEICVERVKNRIWELEGYVLQTGLKMAEAEKHPVGPYEAMSAGERKIARREGK